MQSPVILIINEAGEIVTTSSLSSGKTALDVKAVISGESFVQEERVSGESILRVNNDYKTPFKTSWFQSYLNNGGSIEMAVDGSSSNVVFGYFADTTYDTYITELRLHGQDHGSSMLDFLGISNGLTNGLQLDFKSKNITNVLMNLQTTWDIFVKFVYPSEEFYIIQESASSHFVTAVRKFDNPIVIKKQGTYAYDDYVVMRVRDNLTGMDILRCTLFGYKE